MQRQKIALAAVSGKRVDPRVMPHIGAVAPELAEPDIVAVPIATVLEDEDQLVLPAAVPLSKHGDLWLLGDHRLLCGNALGPADFIPLMAEELAAMVFIDPPYNVPIDGHVSGLGVIHHRPFVMASGEMDKAAFTTFLSQACRNLAAFSADGSIHFVCMDWRHVGELLAAGHEAYGELKNLCVWIKDNGGMGSLYRSQLCESPHSRTRPTRMTTLPMPYPC